MAVTDLQKAIVDTSSIINEVIEETLEDKETVEDTPEVRLRSSTRTKKVETPMAKPPPYNINGTDYFTVAQFAKMTRRAPYRIRDLVNNGNKIRTLKVMRIETMIFIEASEVHEFPFTAQGNSSLVINIDEYGNEKLVRT